MKWYNKLGLCMVLLPAFCVLISFVYLTIYTATHGTPEILIPFGLIWLITGGAWLSIKK